MGRTIIVPTDFSEGCLLAAEKAAILAELFDMRVCLLHAYNHYTRAWLAEQDADVSLIQQNLDTLAYKLTNGKEIEVEGIIIEGTIYEALPLAIRRMEAQVVILSSWGKTGFQRFTKAKLLRILSASTAPTIIFNQKTNSMLRKIFMPVNIFRRWNAKIDAAARICKLYKATLFIAEMHPGTVFEKEHKEQLIRLVDRLNQEEIEYIIVPINHTEYDTEEYTEKALLAGADFILLTSDEEEEGNRFKAGPDDEKLIFNSANLPVVCVNPFMRVRS